MRAVAQRVAGTLLEEEDRVGLILRDSKPAQEVQDVVILRFAFVVRGPGIGDHVFPAFILDDWGREIRSLKLYRWVRENGDRFPRAEIFGFERDGRETQCFLRELELYARLPCYVYDNMESHIPNGRQVNAVFLPDDSVKDAKLIAKPRPKEVEQPLRRAMVTWWRIPIEGFEPDLSHLTVPPEPGY